MMYALQQQLAVDNTNMRVTPGYYNYDDANLTNLGDLISLSILLDNAIPIDCWRRY
jgi:hypothetical protein